MSKGILLCKGKITTIERKAPTTAQKAVIKKKERIIEINQRLAELDHDMPKSTFQILKAGRITPYAYEQAIIDEKLALFIERNSLV